MSERQYVTFRVGDEWLGVDVRLVREIHRAPGITPVSPAPPYVAGLLNLRGQIITVLDLGIRLGIPRPASAGRVECIVLKTDAELDRMALEGQLDERTGAESVAFWVDRIGDIVTMDSSLIEPPPAHVSRAERRFLSGVAKRERELLVTLNVAEIVSVDDGAGVETVLKRKG